MSLAESLKTGDTIGRYKLLREVARGALGPLWTANFDHDGKSLLSLCRVFDLGNEVEEGVRSGLSESSWEALELDSPRIARAAEVVFEDTRLVTIYDYIEGEPLSSVERLKSAKGIRFSVGVALRVALSTLDALGALHTTAVELGATGAFGGLSPDSVHLGTDGQVRLLDAFVAGCAAQQSNLLLTPERVNYAAPEQLTGGVADARSDVYALGCLLWEMLSNRRMHSGAVGSIKQRVAKGNISPLSVVSRGRGELSDALVRAVNRAISTDPESRFDSPTAMAGALLGCGIEPATDSELAKVVETLAADHLKAHRQASEDSTIVRLADVVNELRAPRPNGNPPAPRPHLAPGAIHKPPSAKSERSSDPAVSKQKNSAPEGGPSPLGHTFSSHDSDAPTAILQVKEIIAVAQQETTKKQQNPANRALLAPTKLSPNTATSPGIAKPTNLRGGVTAQPNPVSPLSDSNKKQRPASSKGTLLGITPPNAAAAFRSELLAPRPRVGPKASAPKPPDETTSPAASGGSAQPVIENASPLPADSRRKPVQTPTDSERLASRESATELENAHASSNASLGSGSRSSVSEYQLKALTRSANGHWNRVTWFFAICTALLSITVIVLLLKPWSEPGTPSKNADGERVPSDSDDAERTYTSASAKTSARVASSSPTSFEGEPENAQSAHKSRATAATAPEGQSEPQTGDTIAMPGVATSTAPSPPRITPASKPKPKTRPKRTKKRIPKQPKRQKYVPDDL